MLARVGIEELKLLLLVTISSVHAYPHAAAIL